MSTHFRHWQAGPFEALVNRNKGSGGPSCTFVSGLLPCLIALLLATLLVSVRACVWKQVLMPRIEDPMEATPSRQQESLEDSCVFNLGKTDEPNSVSAGVYSFRASFRHIHKWTCELVDAHSAPACKPIVCAEIIQIPMQILRSRV